MYGWLADVPGVNHMPRAPTETANGIGSPKPTRAMTNDAGRARGGEPRVVGIGASAGGLEACTKLMAAFPADAAEALILVQHLDPTHPSMMVELLSAHTTMPVAQATDGMPVAPGRLHVIPPGVYLSVRDGMLRLSRPEVARSARMPFDFLLRSLAEEYGARAACVVLSGTGADGSAGLAAIHARGGLVIAQDPREAGYAGMPDSAIATGLVDRVLPVAVMAAALADARVTDAPAGGDALAEIVAVLRAKTAFDFTHYKSGTLERRIERRRALAKIPVADAARYLAMVSGDAAERDALVKDLLIHVTSFFRDQPTFDFLAETTIPDLVRDHPADRPIRVWVAGCSTGEETYSLAMLLREAITSAKRDVKLQIFASDVDPVAVAIARDGLYAPELAATVSEARLARFFAREDRGFRALPELREAVVFSVQDVLADPPFSKLDLISCRNLMIYLKPDAQARVIKLFHFALRQNGLLLLGGAETAGNAAGRFQLVSKPARLYRRLGDGRADTVGVSPAAGHRPARLPGKLPAPSRQSVLAELSRAQVLNLFAPASVLVNARHECLYALGPVDRYLRVPAGHQTPDLLARARPGLRTRLLAAMKRATAERARVVVDGGHAGDRSHGVPFDIDVQPLASGGEDLLMVCFVERPARRAAPEPAVPGAPDGLAHELAATKAELQAAISDLETSGEEQKAINEEALSVNEEFQSTNEELLTSKEELQSLNEELTALNSQLQETLERQRTTSDDLQNVLYSTDVATLFLGTDLNIRFFTPATKALFNVIPGDVGRPLADLHSLASDETLSAEARAVLVDRTPSEREVQTPEGVWFRRRILPYLAHDGRVEGVVITFHDVSKRLATARALEAAKQQAEQANAAKSRFLAAASHDLRQPMQTLSLLQGLLAKAVQGDTARGLVARLDDTLGAMTGMLNTLLDINQIEAGVIRADTSDFQVDALLARLRDEFSYHALAQGLSLRMVPCGMRVRSDPRLLEQMLRNLLHNAIKYTRHGRVLLGCRRYRGAVTIQIWDTGVGIPDEELGAIFQEHHQLDNPARERSRGLGLGLAIVQRLADLLGHRLGVRSRHGRGSVFSIEVPLVPAATHRPAVARPGAAPARHGTVLVCEDDPEVRALLELTLRDDGHDVRSAADGTAALELVGGGAFQPGLILADFNLPGGLNGLKLVARLRERLGAPVPAIILTGDRSAETVRSIDGAGCESLNKPVKLADLTTAISRLMAAATPVGSGDGANPFVVFVVDDDPGVLATLRAVLEDDGRLVETFKAGEAFLAARRSGRAGCLLIDAYLPGIDGIEVLRRLRANGDMLPAIMITGDSDVGMAVAAMKAGASDFIEKPVAAAELLASLDRALERSSDAAKRSAWRDGASAHLAGLTSRQRQVMRLVLAGQPSKNIASDLGMSQRTVENHRAAIMRRTGTKSLPALARLAVAAEP